MAPETNPLPKFLMGPAESQSPRQEAILRLLQVVSPELLRKRLFCIVWEKPEMERRVYQLFKGLRDAEDLDEIVELQLLDCISDDTVRADLAAWTRSEPDPRQRNRLAKIVAGVYQSPEFLPLIEELARDNNDLVLETVLRGIDLQSSRFRKNAELRNRVIALTQSLADSSRPEGVRLGALKAMRNVDDASTTRLLMRFIAHDKSDRIVTAALWSLPDAFQINLKDRPLESEMIRLVFSVATDASRSRDVRWAAARVASGNDSITTPVLDASEKAIVEKLKQDLWPQ